MKLSVGSGTRYVIHAGWRKICKHISRPLVLSEHFDTDPRSRDWFLTNWSFAETESGGYDETDKAIFNPSSSDFWRTPQHYLAPFEYCKITFCSKGPGIPWVGGVGLNTDTTYGRYPSESSALGGQLVADDWTTFDSSVSWESHVYFTRARVNAIRSACRLGGDDIEFGDVVINLASRRDVRRWADQLYDEMPKLSYSPPADRFENLTRTKTKLDAGDDVKIVMLCDSIMNDTGNSTFDVQLEQLYNINRVRIVTAVGGGTGVDKWNDDANWNWPDHDLDVQQGVIAQKPDLVMIGGISNGTNYQDFRDLIDKIKTQTSSTHGYIPDIMVLTGAISTLGDPTGYATELEGIASDKSAAFLDMRSVTEDYFTAASAEGYDRSYFMRDAGTHANHYGKQLMARVLVGHMAPWV